MHRILRWMWGGIVGAAVLGLAFVGIRRRAKAEGAAEGRFQAEKDAIEEASDPDLRRRLEKLIRVLVVGGVLSSSSPLSARIEADDARGAWEAAVGLAVISPAESQALRHPRVTIHDRPRFLKGRRCGETLGYYEVDLDGTPRFRLEVLVYAFPWEHGLAYLVLVHEFLHVIHYQIGPGRGIEWMLKNADSEAWVRSRLPMECPAYVTMAEEDR